MGKAPGRVAAEAAGAAVETKARMAWALPEGVRAALEVEAAELRAVVVGLMILLPRRKGAGRSL